MKGIWSWGSSKIATVTNGISGTYHSVSNGISATYHSVTNRISDTYHAITNRMSETYYSVTEGISDTYQFTSNVIDSIYTHQGVRNFVYSFTIKGWEGATRVLDPTNVTKMFHSNKTRQALKASFKANVLYYLSIAMLAEYTREQIVHAVSVTGDESQEAWFSATTAVNMLFNLGLGAIMLHRNYDNTLINLTLAKVVVDENPMSHHYVTCGCDDGALITAGLFSAVDLTAGKLLSLWVASNVPVIKYLTPMGYAFAYGEGLAEYPYSSVGMCTKHRVEALKKDNAYSLGIGSMLYLFSQMANSIIYSRTGLSSFFINSAVSSAIFPLFITSVLLREKPLPGDKQGMDYFYYQRQALQHLSGRIGKSLLPIIMKCNNAALDYDLVPMSALHANDVKKAMVGRIYLSDTGEYVVRNYEGKVHQGLIDITTIDLKEWNSRVQKPEFKTSILQITSDAGHTPSKTKAKLNKICEYRLTKLIMWVLSRDIYGDWHSMKGLQTSPSTMLFFNEYYPLIEKQLNAIVNLRETSYVGKVVPVVPEWLKQMLLSEEYNALIRVVFDVKLGNLIKGTQQALKKINSTQQAAQIKVVIKDKKLWDEMVIREGLGVQSAEIDKRLLLDKPPVNKLASTSELKVAVKNPEITSEMKPEIKPKAKSSHISQGNLAKNDIVILPEPKMESKPDLNVEKVDAKIEAKPIPVPIPVLQLPGYKELASLGMFSEPTVVQQPVKPVIQPKRRALHIVENYDPDALHVNHQAETHHQNEVKNQIQDSTQVEPDTHIQNEVHAQIKDLEQPGRVASSPYSWKGVNGSNPSRF